MLYIIKIAYRNIYRNIRRTLLTIAAITISIAAFVIIQGWMEGLIGSLIDNTIRVTSGHIRIVNKFYLEKERLLPIHFNIPDISDMISRLKNNPEITEINPRIRFGTQVEHGNNYIDALGIAFDPDSESHTSRIKDYIVRGSYFKDSNDGVIIGIKTAEELGADVGDNISFLVKTVNFTPNLMEYPITGIFESGINAMDRGLFYISLKNGSDLLYMDDSATEILLFINDPDSAVSLADSLKELDAQKDLCYIPWQKENSIKGFLGSYDVTKILIMLTFGIVSGLTILNTMMMAVFERTREIGILGALGMTQADIMKMIMLESIIIGLIGSVLGSMLGFGIAYGYLENIGIEAESIMKSLGGWLLPSRLYADFQLIHIIYGFILGALISILSVIYPSVKASRVSPSEALRSL